MEYKGNGVAINLFGLEIRWYAVLIVVGMMLAVYLLSKEMKRRGIDGEEAYDIALVILPAGIIGARIWYVIFEFKRYDNFLDMINIRNGGLAIQGGLMMAAIVALIYAKKKKFSFLRLSDMIFPYVALAQSIGRWGNFTNNEAHGGPTNLPWALKIGAGRYHPTFLYESIGDFLIFVFLYYFTRKKLKVDGQVTMLYMILYGSLRFFVEGLRTDSLYWGNIRVAQALSVIGIIVGICGLIILSRKSPNAHVQGKSGLNKKV